VHIAKVLSKVFFSMFWRGCLKFRHFFRRGAEPCDCTWSCHANCALVLVAYPLLIHPFRQLYRNVSFLQFVEQSFSQFWQFHTETEKAHIHKLFRFQNTSYICTFFQRTKAATPKGTWA